MDLVNRLLNGDKRACARLISLIENESDGVSELLREIHKHTGRAYVIGITGPPGGGKSTLTDKITKYLRKQGKTVGIIAIDPASPFTGGAILGDRIRMQDLATDKGVFMRSMGTRGHLGGLSKATRNAVKVLDAYGSDVIIVETVGVGQSEVDIVKTADTVIMIMVPGLGDDIQAIKAGVMEIGDVFAVNKSDLDGASRTVTEINMMLDLAKHEGQRPPVVQVIARKNEGIDVLVEKAFEHKAYMEETNKFYDRRKKNTELEIMELVKQELMDRVKRETSEEGYLEDISDKVFDRETDPYSARDAIVDMIIK